MNRLGKKVVWPIGAGVLLLGLWYFVKYAWALPIYILPAPHEVLEAAWRERRTLAFAAGITFQGAIFGFLAAVLGGLGLALLLGWSRRLNRAFTPYVLLFQMTPVVILAPIYVLWLGQGLPAIVAITFMICFFPVAANTGLGLASVDRNLADLFVMLEASRRDTLLRLRIPAALPHFLTGMRIAATLAPIGAITGDFLAGSAQNGVGGLGFVAVIYFSQLKTAELFAAGLVGCLLGFAFVGAVKWLSWRLLRGWHESAAAPV
jgi:NitT/TauT family transport system permease protein